MASCICLTSAGENMSCTTRYPLSTKNCCCSGLMYVGGGSFMKVLLPLVLVHVQRKVQIHALARAPVMSIVLAAERHVGRGLGLGLPRQLHPHGHRLAVGRVLDAGHVGLLQRAVLAQ